MFKRVEHLYEVSIWTLQDSFITVLKWSGIENKGQIQKPKLIFDSDGTSNFNFSIPMYLENNEENPIWYNTTNGNLMIGMRKIKVILNKGKSIEKVYEFIITKVNERHENNQLFCDVECEGLAFHELGKIGYKLSLSPEEFYRNYENWFISGEGDEPKATIDYWLKLIGISSKDEAESILPNKWYYKIDMNWGAFNYDAGFNPKKIYEEEYISSWQFENNSLTAQEIVQPEEKRRMVSIEESNLYNITQKIAETFHVFCRYEYQYDEQYHIIARTIVFYNNFLEEDSGYMDLTYPYHTSEISREMDSSELTTKLFVRPVDYEYSSTGQITIMSVDANKSREDYLLNFDYLHNFQIISDEQYKEIDNYEIALHNINIELENLETQIIVLEQQKLNLESKIQIEKNGKDAAIKQQTLANDHITALTNNNQTGTITIDKTNAKALVVLQNKDTGTYYVKIPFVGVIPETVRLYNGTLDYTKEDPFEDTELVTNGEFVFDEYGQLIQVNRLSASYSSLWLTCEYVPETYWTTISNYWGTEVNKINAQLLIDEAKVEPLITSLNTVYERQETLLTQKATTIKDFEEMMGPALREGYWQPDDYKDYGNKQTAVFDSFTTIDKATYIYDTNEYEEDTKLTYYEGNTSKKYLTIDLSFLDDEQLRYISNNYNQLSFIYYDKNIIDLNNSLEDATLSQKMAYIKNTVKSIPIDSGCRFGFIKIGNTTTIKPALIIEESKIMTAEQITFFLSHSGNYISKIGIFNYNTATYTPTIDNNAIDISPSYYLINSNISEVHHRIIINSLSLKTSEDELLLCLNNTLLKEFKDYSIFIKTDVRDNIEKYFINIKPQIYFQLGNLMPICKINYTISNADLLIYLDALQVSKENAFPKVAYTVKLSVYDPMIIHDIYNKMCKVVHINDVQLKFDNVQGYISHIEIDLDHPWEDSIEVKNYKTKFEDLFSNIVAQTEAMSKNSFNYDVAAAAFNSDGTMANNTTEKMLLSNTSIFDAYLDSYFDTSQVVRDRLSDIFTEAGAVLNDANSALFNIAALTTKNADILAGFARGANEGFTKDIELISSDSFKTSAIRISKDKGIFIGANLGVSIFSGGAGIGGSSVDLNADHLLLGVSDNEEGTAAIFTKRYIVLAAGDIIHNSEIDPEDENYAELGDITGSPGGLVGAKFTKNSIGFATESNNIINAIIMNDKGLTLGSGITNLPNGVTLATATNQQLRNLSSNSGSYVRLSNSGLELGSLANLYINTNNFKLQTNSGATDQNNQSTIGNTIFAIGSNLNGITSNTNISSLNSNSAVNFLVNKSGAFIKGTVYADAGSFTGNIQATSLTIVSSDPNNTANNELQKLLNGDIQAQIDNEIQTWMGSGTPTPFGKRTTQNINGESWVNDYTITNLSNISHINHEEWNSFTSENAEDNIKTRHIGDIYYDIAPDNNSKTAGWIFRWVKNNEDYYWISISDTISTKTLELISEAQTDIETIFDLGRPLGNYFNKNDTIYYASLNAENGLIIAGNNDVNDVIGIFRATHNVLGFFALKSYENISRNAVFSRVFSKSNDGILHVDETAFTNNTDPLLYYKNGSMYISGTLFAGRIVVKNTSESDNGSSFNDYIDSRVTTNLVEDCLSASDYYKLLQGNFTGWDTSHNSAQTFWSNLQSTINDIPNTYATEASLSNYATNSKVNDVINGTTGLAFSTTGANTYVNLEKTLGLIIIGAQISDSTSDYVNEYPFFRVSNNVMGFFTTTTIPSKTNNALNSAPIIAHSLLYFEDGDLAIKGNIYAKGGWLGGVDGWKIATGALESTDGTILLHTSTANTVYGSGATFALRKKNQDNSFTNMLVFNGTSLEVAGTIKASGGWLGTNTNGWIIGTDTINNIQVGRIQSANNKLILSAGTSDSSQNPYILLKDSNNNTVFKVQQGEVEITGTIKASGGWFGAEDGWVIGGNLTTAKSITTIMGSSTGIPQSTSNQTGSRIQSSNNKIILNAGSSSTEPYLIMRKSNGNGGLEDIFEYYNGNLALKGMIRATSGWFGGQGGWIINGGSTFAITSIITNNTISLTNNLLYSSNGKIIFDAGTSNSSSYIIMRDNNANVIFEYNNGNIAIKGDITATSFKLGNTSITLDNNGHFNSSLIDTSGFTTDGVSTQTWNGNSYVSLTQASDNFRGVLIGTSGASKHFIIPRGNSTAAIDICPTYIYFDYYTSTTSTQPASYIHMDNNGLSISGNRISINGNQIWARDDIVIMNPNATGTEGWRSSVSRIETKMQNQHDWVLIRPYYNASISCNVLNIDPINSLGNSSPQVRISLNTNQQSLGSGGDYYIYKITGKIQAKDNSSNVDKVYIGLSNNSNFELSQNNHSNTSTSVVIEANININENNGYVQTNTGTSFSGTIRRDSNSSGGKLNLFTDNSAIYLSAYYNSNILVKITDVTIICETDATISCVPCTVYYYP